MYALIVSYWKQSTSHELLAVFVSRWKRFVPNIWSMETAVSNVLVPCGIKIISVPLERATDAGEAWNSDQWRYSACICLESQNICLLWMQWTFCCSKKMTRFVLVLPTQARTTDLHSCEQQSLSKPCRFGHEVVIYVSGESFLCMNIFLEETIQNLNSLT